MGSNIQKSGDKEENAQDPEDHVKEDSLEALGTQESPDKDKTTENYENREKLEKLCFEVGSSEEAEQCSRVKRTVVEASLRECQQGYARDHTGNCRLLN